MLTQAISIAQDQLSILPGYVNGFGLLFNTTSIVDISEGFCMDSNDEFFIQSSGNIQLNIVVSGIGGLDTGSESPDTWYAIHVIGDSTEINPVSGILSISQMSPTLPSGYDIFRRVGWVRNNGSSNILDFQITGSGNNRVCEWLFNVFAKQVLVAGTASVATSVDCSMHMPPTSRYVSLSCSQVSGIAGFTLKDVGGQLLQGFKPDGGFRTTAPTTASGSIAYQVFTGVGDFTINVDGWWGNI